MRHESFWSIENVQFARLLPLVVATASIGFATPAMAAGTTAGTTISNTATATFNDPAGNQQSQPSNTVDILVDELLDVVVDATDASDVVVTPGATQRVLTYSVTNSGNGSEAFRLTANPTIGGDQFDPTVTSIVIDNGDGVFGPGDTVYVAGSNDPVLAPDGSVTVFILSTIPAGAVDSDRGFAELTAAAVTGTGAPGTTFPGAGQGGGAAVVGSTGADSTDRGAYIIQSATLSFVKSAVTADPFGGTRPVPGAIVTYTLVATVSGSGSLSNAQISDTVPIGTTYQAGTITLQGGALTDATDGDAGQFTLGAVSVSLGTVPAGQTRTVTFRTKIN
ncbi:MAG: hypothetical protein ACKVOJ_10535 [Sphingomonadaceae bacterium]